MGMKTPMIPKQKAMIPRMIHRVFLNFRGIRLDQSWREFNCAIGQGRGTGQGGTKRGERLPFEF